MKSVLIILISYLIGSIPFGYLVGKIGYRIDIREHGSRNIGFTNILRTLGPVPAAITIIGDVLKGVLAVLLAQVLNMSDAVVIVAGLAAIAGHNWSLYLKFSGGRGVATGAGVVLALTWQITLPLIVLWLVIVGITRYVSLASIIVVALYPVLVIYFKMPLPYILLGLIGAPVIIWQHRANIRRLIRGEEHKLGQKSG